MAKHQEKLTRIIPRQLDQIDRGQRFRYKLGYFQVTNKNHPDGIEVELVSGHYGKLLPGQSAVLPRRTKTTIKVKEKRSID